MPQDEQLLARARGALRQVIDPELGLNVVDLGLVAGLSEDRGLLTLRYRLTSADCPVGGMIASGMHDAVQALEGVAAVQMELDESAPWGPECMSPEGRLLMGFEAGRAGGKEG